MEAGVVQMRYPLQLTLEDGTHIVARLLERTDKIALAQFFQRIPEDDRLYFKDNVTSPDVVRGWTEQIDLERTIPVVAVADERIVADATLHRGRAKARRHVGELRLTVDPEYRGRGLGFSLIQELIDLAAALQLRTLFFELVDQREEAAIHAAYKCGFSAAAVLSDRVKDAYGNLQDLVVMELSLEARDRIHQFLIDHRTRWHVPPVIA